MASVFIVTTGTHFRGVFSSQALAEAWVAGRGYDITEREVDYPILVDLAAKRARIAELEAEVAAKEAAIEEAKSNRGEEAEKEARPPTEEEEAEAMRVGK